MVFLQVDKTFTKNFSEYSNYADVFTANFVIKLPKHNGMNNHAIKLIESKQLSYGLIYSLD